MLFASILAFRPLHASLLDQSFDAGEGPGDGDLGDYLEVVVQPDGKILVGGNFTTFNHTTCDGVVRLNADGSIDRSFHLGPGTPTKVRALALQPDGKIIVGGWFQSFYGKTCSALARLNSDGSLDESFWCNSTNTPEAIFSASLQPDGKIIAGGLGGVARFLENGQADPNFNPAYVDLVIADVGAQPNGAILAGGPPVDFGVPFRMNLSRWKSDGALDDSFAPGARNPPGVELGIIMYATDIEPQSDGKILVAGVVGIRGWEDSPPAIRLLSDGTLDPDFRMYTSGPSPWNERVLSRPDGRVIVGGWPMVVEGLARHSLAQVSSTGRLDVNFDPDIEWTRNAASGTGEAFITALALQADGKLIVGGQFTSVDGVKRVGLARLFDSTPSDTNLISLLVETPRVIEGNLNVAAQVIRAEDMSRRVNVDYSTQSGSAVPDLDYQDISGTLIFEPGERTKLILIPILDNTVRQTGRTFSIRLSNPSAGAGLGDHISEEITIIDDDGFQFDRKNYSVDESSRELVMRVWVPQNYVAYRIAYTTEDATGKAGRDYIASEGILEFSSWWQDSGFRTVQVPIIDNPAADGDRAFTVTLRNPTSGLPLGPDSTTTVTITDNDTVAGPAKGANGTIVASAGLADGRIVIGGWFTSVDGLTRPYVARLRSNGLADETFNPNPGPNAPVSALALQPDGKVVIGGLFTNVAGVSRGHIARLNADGSLDVRFNPGAGWSGPSPDGDLLATIRAVLIQPDGKILTAGSFTNFNGILHGGLARMLEDGSFDPSFVPELQSSALTPLLALQRDGKILVGAFSPILLTTLSCD
jgi:uncharacterized delta-60 repeat protein